MKLEIVKLHGLYAVRRKCGIWPFSWYEYLDLKIPTFWWPKSSPGFGRDCFCHSRETAIKLAQESQATVVEVIK